MFEHFREKEPAKISRKEYQVDIKQLLSTIENPASEETSTKAIHHEEGTGPSIEIYEPQLKPFDFSELEITGVIFDTYITAVDGSSFYLIDQHAAHERIFYEKLVGEYESSEKARQSLLVPLIINGLSLLPIWDSQ